MELEDSTFKFTPVHDRRRRVLEPLPVWLVAIEDVRLPTHAELETQLDAFYVDLLKMERDTSVEAETIYRADNVRLRFEIREGLIEREVLRPTQIEVPSLGLMEQQIVERELGYSRQRGLLPGQESLLLLDPAGNWIELLERKLIM